MAINMANTKPSKDTTVKNNTTDDDINNNSNTSKPLLHS